MAVQFHKVTWYSKVLAGVFFIALPFLGFYLGVQYGKLEMAAATPASLLLAQSANIPPEYYENVAEWQTDQRTDRGFSFAYPLDFQVADDYSSAQSTDWRLNVDMPGELMITLAIPKAFEPQTNFSDARLTIGRSGNGAALQNCVLPSANGSPATYSTTTINGISFAKYVSADAGAGNYYETTSYRTVHAGQCWAVEYTIHSNQIANYPPEYHLKQFDETKVKSVLEGIVGTFRFL
jgi:hypothetical protein